MATQETRERRKKPLPRPSSLTGPFWEGTKQGVLLLQRCTRCHNFIWTPQLACPQCLSDALEWTEVSGHGTIYSYTVVHRAATPAFKAPYTIAIVELAEGPRILTDLIDLNPQDVRIGMEVQVDFEDVGEVALYHFRPRR